MTENPNLQGVSLLTMLTTVIAAASSTVVTAAVGSEKAIGTGFNIVNNTLGGVEDLSVAGRTRMRTHANHWAENDELSNRELAVKHRIRLKAVLAQEAELDAADKAEKSGKSK